MTFVLFLAGQICFAPHHAHCQDAVKITPLPGNEDVHLNRSRYSFEIARPVPTEPVITDYLRDILIPSEARYFSPSVGLDSRTGLPYDHRRFRLKEGILGEMGNYTAASKLSLVIPFYIKVIQKDPLFEKVDLKPEQAVELLDKTLDTLLKYIKEFPDFSGFMPWVDIRPNATVAPSNTKLPSLDNGQMTWALAAVSAAFENSPLESYRRMARKAEAILVTQDYRKFYDPERNLLYGTIQKDAHNATWRGDKSYYLDDMFEGTLAVLWGILHGQIPEEVWYNLEIPTVDYQTEQGEWITTFHGFRASFHEHWGLLYLPYMNSDLSVLYYNFLYAQADHARRNRLPGFLTTSYSPKGNYRQMGVAEIAYNPVDRTDVAVVFGTAMGLLISPDDAGLWLKEFYKLNAMQTPYGATESVGSDGVADIFTADGKGMTLMAASGGVVAEVEAYLKSRTVPRSGISMYVKLMELLRAKYLQMLESRAGREVYWPQKPFPAPPERIISIEETPLPDPGPEYSITEHLQNGHLHGKNVRSLEHFSLEDDVFPGQDFAFEYEIPAYYPYFDQWAFRGTYVDQAVRISEMKYLSFSVPAGQGPQLYELELKSDGITLASVMVNTGDEGVYSEDGQWKTLVARLDPIPESEYKAFNYIAVAIHDPQYLLGQFSHLGREGTVVLRDIRLVKAAPPGWEDTLERRSEKDHFRGMELIRYWRMNHGNLPFEKNDFDGIYTFKGGSGWRGGYLPYTDMRKFRYLWLKFRSTTGECNQISIEIKNEADQLLGYKLQVMIDPSPDWKVYEIELPEHVLAGKPLNYFAVSDPYRSVDLGSIRLGNHALEGADVQRPDVQRKPNFHGMPRCKSF